MKKNFLERSETVMEPLVSVNCITYNHAPFIRDALNGFVMQKTNFPFEVLVHDDASTDGTQDIIREYERDFPDIFKVIYQKENQYSKGIKASRIYQLPRAKGKYMASCEGDDYWIDPNKLQMQTDYMEKHPDCSCVFHPAIWLDYSCGGRVCQCNQDHFVETDFRGEFILGHESISTCSMFYKTEVAANWPKFREIANIGDFPLKCLLATYGYYHYFPKVMGVYRWNHSTSWNKRYKEDRIFALKNALNALRWLYEFNIYSKRKFETNVGRIMMYYITLRLDAIDAVSEFRWIQDLVVEAHGKKDAMVEYKQLWKKTDNKVFYDKYKDAEKEYYAWFVKRVGEEEYRLP